MPELPEVETTCRGIKPHLQQQIISQVIIRQAQLRWRVPEILQETLPGRAIIDVTRRGKYILLNTTAGTVILHLGMSGSLRILPADNPASKHDHVDIVLRNGNCLRLRDPRRFGAILWAIEAPLTHPLLAKLGIEPLTAEFTGAYLHNLARKRKQAIKAFIMDSQIVVGVGNIYASEALFQAGIHPQRAAVRISLARYELLAERIKAVLSSAIECGGTTLRDFQDSKGNPGYFKQRLLVYGRTGLTCKQCCSILKHLRIAQRSSVYCAVCQR